MVKEWKKNNIESVRKTRNKNRVTYNKAYPEKRKARRLVWKALKTSKLIKQPCACGCIEVQGHHEDYSKPLEVRWMCKPCHAKYHRRKEDGR